MSGDLNTFVPEARGIELAGKTVVVLPLRIRQVPMFARLIAPAAAILATGDLLAAVTRYGEDLIQAVAVATGESVEWVGELTSDDFVLLAGLVVEVNADFFVQQVMPKLTKVSDTLMAMLGRMPSTHSSTPATATPPASTTP